MGGRGRDGREEDEGEGGGEGGNAETQVEYNERQVLTCRYLCNQSSNG